MDALIFLHENKILHGDLKAANVLLLSSDQDKRAFVAKVRERADACLESVTCTHKLCASTLLTPVALEGRSVFGCQRY